LAGSTVACIPHAGRGGPGQQCAWPARQRDYRRNLCAGPPALPDCRRPRCLFRKSSTSVMTRRTSCPRRRASSPHGARLLDSRLRGNDTTHQGTVATGSVFTKWTSRPKLGELPSAAGSAALHLTLLCGRGCACTASGHTAAAPPRMMMNSRRLIRIFTSTVPGVSALARPWPRPVRTAHDATAPPRRAPDDHYTSPRRRHAVSCVECASIPQQTEWITCMGRLSSTWSDPLHRRQCSRLQVRFAHV
jgi:hypothetical protein